MSDASAPPPAGWYADPENPAGERWWNGSSWSDHKRAAGAPVAPAPASSAPVAVSPATGFTYGSTSPDARPDPYAPVAASGAPYRPAGPYYAPAPYGAAAPGQGTNGLALAGLLVGAIGWLIVPVLAGAAGIVLSAIGLSQAKKREAAGHPNPGRGLAIAGLIVGIAVTSLTIIGYVAVVATLLASS